MRLCFKLHGKKICFDVPVLIPGPFRIPGPDPVENQGLLHDAVVLNSMQAAVEQIAAPQVKAAASKAIAAMLKTFQEHAGPDVEVHLDERSAAKA